MRASLKTSPELVSPRTRTSSRIPWPAEKTAPARKIRAAAVTCPPVPLLAANWKMYKGPRETRAFCEAFRPSPEIEVVLCPPFVSLAPAVESGHTVFAQNVHWADEGAFTGEISAPM